MNIFSRFIAYLRWAKEETLDTPVSDVYTSLSKNNAYEELVQYDKRKAELKKILQEIPSSYTRVLDLACGTGVFIDALPHKKHVMITGVDLTPGMLAIAKKRFHGKKNISFIQSDFTKTHFPNNSFDLITIANALRFVPKQNEKEFVAHISNWLTKKATLLIVEVDPFVMPLLQIFHHTPNTALFHEKNIIHMMQSKFILTNKYISPWKFAIFQLGQTKGYYFRKKVG